MPVKIRGAGTSPVVSLACLLVGGALVFAAASSSPAPPGTAFTERITAAPQAMQGAALVGLPLSLYGVSSLVAAPFERRRAAALRRQAEALRFTLVRRADDLREPGWGALSFFARSVDAVLSGSSAGTEVALCPYTYQEDKAARSGAIACFRLPRRLPDFSLAPEGLGDRIASALGGQDVDFPSHPGFSKQYRLRGDESALRSLFDPEILSTFERRPGWTVESAAGWLGVHRPRQPVRPDELGGFLAEASAVYALFAGK